MIAIIIGLLMISCINDFTNQLLGDDEKVEEIVVEGSNYTILSNSVSVQFFL